MSLEERFALDEETRLTTWFPVAKELGIPVPKTELVRVTYADWSRILDGEAEEPEGEFDEVKAAAKNIGYPVFIRSDLAAAKHSMDGPSVARNERELSGAIWRVVEEHEMAWMIPPYKHFAVREFLPLIHSFKAWGGTPVAKERRLFVRDGEVQCYHPYWPETAIRFYQGSQPEPADWPLRLRRLNTITSDEKWLLTTYARKLGRSLGKYWSVDFAEAAFTTEEHELHHWYLIDMARGEISYHWEGCEFGPKVVDGEEHNVRVD